VYFP